MALALLLESMSSRRFFRKCSGVQRSFQGNVLGALGKSFEASFCSFFLSFQ